MEAHAEATSEVRQSQLEHDVPAGPRSSRGPVPDTQSCKRKLSSRNKKAKEKDKRCPQCSYCTHDGSILKVHVRRVHDNERPFPCDLCAYAAKSSGALAVHVKGVHERNKNFACTMCNFRSAYKHKLQKHITGVHLGLKEFGCTFCPYRSSSKSNVDVHIKYVHLKESKTGYKCNQCGLIVNRRSKLAMHTKRVHGTEIDKIYLQACEQQVCSEENDDFEDEDNDEVIEVSPNIIECMDDELEDEYEDYFEKWEEEEEAFIEEEDEDEEFEYDESEAHDYASFLDAQLDDIPDVVRVINLGGVADRREEVEDAEDPWLSEMRLAEALEKVSRLNLTLTRTLLIPLTLPLSTEAVELLRSVMPQSPREAPRKRAKMQAKRRRRKKKRVAKNLNWMAK